MIYEIQAYHKVPEISEYSFTTLKYALTEKEAEKTFNDLINNEKRIHYATIEKIGKTSRKIIRSYSK